MKKSELSSALESYIRENLSPTAAERSLISKRYGDLSRILKGANFQTGSYARFTATTPVNDLDVIWVLPKDTYNEKTVSPDFDPGEVVEAISEALRTEYAKLNEDVRVKPQSHSVGIYFGDEDEFSIDVVPAIELDEMNEFGDSIYWVPEITSLSRTRRRQKYESGEEIGWIRSDPRGYVEAASRLNEKNDAFRKSAKFVKAWRSACKDADSTFALKSFHVEQVVAQYFQNDPDIKCFDVIFRFFCEIPDLIEYPQIPDRTDPERRIDAYVEDLTDEEKELITQARDFFLIKLEDCTEAGDIPKLLDPGFHERASSSESFLFDQGIPMLTEGEFSITARALQRSGSFRERILDRLGLIEIDRKIEFRVGGNAPSAEIYKWKVKNDDSAPEPRGEITDHKTRNDPEETRYNGRHYVECYAIKDGVCIGRSRQNVVLQSAFGRNPHS